MAVQIQVEPAYIVLRTDKNVLTDEEARECLARLQASGEQRPLIVFDFSKIADIPMPSLRTLTRALGNLTLNDARVCLIAPRDIQAKINEQGLNRLLPCFQTLQEAVNPGDAVAKQKTLEFLNTTLEAVAYTLQVAASTTAVAGKSYVRQANSVTKADIAAVVGLVSGPFNGSLILGFPISTYLKIMSRLLSQEFTEMTPEIRDGAAELLNIILGQVKASLNAKGYAIRQAIPTVVQGGQLQLSPSSPRPSVIVPYSSDIGEFYVELTTASAGAP